jgi:hypothetical protein
MIGEKYVKLNPGIICDKCEDEDRKGKKVQDAWDIIKNHNRQWRRCHAANTQFNRLNRL